MSDRSRSAAEPRGWQRCGCRWCKNMGRVRVARYLMRGAYGSWNALLSLKPFKKYVYTRSHLCSASGAAFLESFLSSPHLNSHASPAESALSTEGALVKSRCGVCACAQEQRAKSKEQRVKGSLLFTLYSSLFQRAHTHTASLAHAPPLTPIPNTTPAASQPPRRRPPGPPPHLRQAKGRPC